MTAWHGSPRLLLSGGRIGVAERIALGWMLWLLLLGAVLAVGARLREVQFVFNLSVLTWSACSLLLWAGKRWTDEPSIRRPGRVVALLGWALVVMVYAVWGAGGRPTWDGWRGDAMLSWAAAVVLVPAVVAMLDRPDPFRGVGRAWAVSGTAWVVLGLLLWTWQQNPLHDWMVSQPWQHGTPFATLDYHGQAGTFIALSGIWVCVWAYATPRRRWVRVFWLLPILLAAVLNASRVAMVLAPAAALVSLAALEGVRWSAGSKRLGLRGLTRVVAAGVIALGLAAGSLYVADHHANAWLSGTALDRITRLQKETSVAHYPRWMEMKAARHLIAEMPWLGSGIGSYPSRSASAPGIAGYYFAPAPTANQTLSAQHHAMSDPLQLTMEWGGIGVALLIMPLVAAMIASLRGFVSPALRKADRGVLVGVAVSLAVMVIHGLVDCTLQLPSTLAIFVLLIALGLSGRSSERAEAK